MVLTVEMLAGGWADSVKVDMCVKAVLISCDNEVWDEHLLFRCLDRGSNRSVPYMPSQRPPFHP